MTHYVKHQSHQENPMIGNMNRINIDGAVVGNHEFNFGKKVLSDAVNQSNFPWLAANILNEKTGHPLFGKPYIIKEFNEGLKVAVVGVTTHYIPNWESPAHITGIKFADALATLKEWVNFIHRTEKPDVLIASYHGGFERDLKMGEPSEELTGENQGYQMCEEIDGIDVLLTGHQHRTLIDKINDVLVIQPGKNGQHYGEIHLELTKENSHWSILNKEAFLKDLEGVSADQNILDYMSTYETATQQWLDQPVGYIQGDMTIDDPLHARKEKHPFIQFIQDVQMDASGVDISVTSLLNNESKGFSSTVTMRDIVSNYMYPNTLNVLALTGADIKAALEKSAEYFALDQNGDIIVNPMYITPKPQHYNYDMWEGIHYTINVARPVGSRIEDLTYHGEPLSDAQDYHVVLNNYRAGGGGNYEMFKNKPVLKDIQKDTVELIHTYFEKHATIQAYTIDNFKVVPR